jgi:hypothetical protein
MTEKPTTLSRRAAIAALGSAAAVPAVAFAGPATADPIFELIADHREAMKAYTAAVHAANRLSEVLPDEQQHWFWTADAPDLPADCADAPEWIDAQLALSRAGEAIEDALFEVLTTVPTTLAGVAAVLDHVSLPMFPDDDPPGGSGDPRILENAFGNVYEDVGDIGDNFLPEIAEAVRRLTTPALASAAIAAVPVVASPRAIIEPDPIFPIIGAHDRAMAHESACSTAIGQLEEALPEDKRTWSLDYFGGGLTPPQGCADAPEWLQAQLNLKEAYARRREAIEALAATEPTSLAGAIALLGYVWSGEYPNEGGEVPILSRFPGPGDNEDIAKTFSTRLAATMRRLIATA